MSWTDPLLKRPRGRIHVSICACTKPSHVRDRTLTASRTPFIVAHRLSTIQHADVILVINDGQIVERGTHAELFALNGKYVSLWSKQLSKDVRRFGQLGMALPRTESGESITPGEE